MNPLIFQNMKTKQRKIKLINQLLYLSSNFIQIYMNLIQTINPNKTKAINPGTSKAAKIIILNKLIGNS